MIRLSVIIPTNQSHDWLDIAIGSVLSQLSEQDELVLVLDGRIAQQDSPWLENPQVVIVKVPISLGVGNALRAGVKASRGRFIARLDSDDVALPGRFEKQLRYLNNHEETVAVATSTQTISDKGKVLGSLNFKPRSDVRADLLFQNVIVQSSIMYRRSSYDAAGGYPAYPQLEDYILWLRMAQLGPLAILPDTLTQYRIHPQQLSKSAKPYGEYIKQALAERDALATTLQKKRSAQILRNHLWILAQFIRYYAAPLGKLMKHLLPSL